MEIVRLSPTMIIAQDGTARSFALNTARGIVVVDTLASCAEMEQAKQLFEAEFRRHDYAFVIDTHDHPEHLGGNALFPAGILVGQEGIIEGLAFQKTQVPAYLARSEQALADEEKTLAGLEQDSPPAQQASAKIAKLRTWIDTLRTGWVPPTVTFRDRLTLRLGDRTVQLISFGRGHSRSDLLVYVPEEKVLLTGGACSLRSLPPAFPGYTGGMDVARWIEVLSEFVDSDVEPRYIIPGHAPYLTKADLAFLRDYYRTLWIGLNEARHDGSALEQVKARFALAARFGDCARLARPTDATVRQHHQNLEDLWAFLNRPAGARRPE